MLPGLRMKILDSCKLSRETMRMLPVIAQRFRWLDLPVIHVRRDHHTIGIA